MIGIIIAGKMAPRCFLDITVEVRAIENIGPTVSARGTVEPEMDIMNDAITARIARTKNLFMHIAVQIAQIMHAIQAISWVSGDCKNDAGVIKAQMIAALLRSSVGEAVEENNPLLATLIFNF